jgi:hypothetical protein
MNFPEEIASFKASFRMVVAVIVCGGGFDGGCAWKDKRSPSYSHDGEIGNCGGLQSYEQN